MAPNGASAGPGEWAASSLPPRPGLGAASGAGGGPAGPGRRGRRPTLILASASPRRRELLVSVGVEAEIRPVDLDETPRPDERADDLVVRLASGKARAVVDCDRPGAVVAIGADTVIALDDEIFGKPADGAEARTMLSRLSGRCHRVLTGVAVSDGGRCLCALDESRVWFRELDAADIDCYVASGEPLDKAGAYAIQGRGALFVDRLEGSFHGIVGLPVGLVDQLCQRLGHPLLTWAPRP